MDSQPLSSLAKHFSLVFVSVSGIIQAVDWFATDQRRLDGRNMEQRDISERLKPLICFRGRAKVVGAQVIGVLQ